MTYKLTYVFERSCVVVIFNNKSLKYNHTTDIHSMQKFVFPREVINGKQNRNLNPIILLQTKNLERSHQAKKKYQLLVSFNSVNVTTAKL